MKILNWNVRGLSGNWAEVLMLSKEFDVMALSETKLTYRRPNVSINDFNHIRLDRGDGNIGGGLIVYIRKDIQYITIQLDRVSEDIDYIAVKLFKETNVINLVSIYIAPDPNIDYGHFQNFFDSLDGLNNLILTGDFNAHDVAWSAKERDQRGCIISSIIPNHDLNVINTENSHTRPYIFNNELRYGSPDITFASSDISILIDWSLLDNRGSDHLPIKMEIVEPNLKCSRSFKRINLKKVNWEIFEEGFISKFDFQTVLSESNFQSVYDEFVKVIYSSLEDSGGILPSSDNKVVNEPQGVIWWNDKCKDLVNSRREALRNYLDNSSIDNFERYLEVVKIVKKGLKEEKKKGFEKFCNSLNPDMPYDIICRMLKDLKKDF